MDQQLIAESERWCAASGQEVPIWCTDVGKHLYGKYHDTTLCHFHTVGRCNKGAGCGFAHGFGELSLFMKMRAAERPSKVKKKPRAQPSQRGAPSPRSPAPAEAGALVRSKQSGGDEAGAGALVRSKQSGGDEAGSGASGSGVRGVPAARGAQEPEEEASPEHAAADVGASDLLEKKLLGQRMVLAVPGTPKERPQAHTTGPPLQLLDRWVQWPAVTPQALQAFLSLHASHKWMIERALIQSMPHVYED